MQKILSLIFAVLTAFTMFSLPVNANQKDTIEDIAEPISPLVDFNEPPRPEIAYGIEAKSDGAVISFNKLSVYSAYPVFDNQPEESRLLLFPIAMSEWDDKLKISGIQANRDYIYAIYEGEEPDDINHITDVHFKTKMADVDLDIADSDSSKVKLSWTNDNYDVTYHIFRSSDGNAFNEIYETFNNTYTDSSVKSGKTYFYYITAASNANGEKVTSNTAETKTTVSYGLPSVSGKCKTWANYTAVTATGSPQYKLLHSDACYTDKETGIRMVGDCYCIALGSYYGTKIGTKYLITLSSGNSFKAILCDQKADRHTDANHQYAVNNQDIIEFYIERAYKPSRVDGDYGVLPQFGGSVVSIEKID